MKTIRNFLFKPTDPTVVSLYRIIFGGFMIYQMIYYFQLDYTFQFMAGPQLVFGYEGLPSLPVLPLGVLKIIHVLLLISTICITIGFWYRAAMGVFFIGFTYFSFIDKTLYNNHLYLISLIAFIMFFSKADAAYSVRAKRGRHIPFLPAWNQYLLIFVIALPYFFGGIAKLSSNWLKTGLVRELLTATPNSFIKRLFSEDVLVAFVTYGGLVYDLVIVWLLLFKRTRVIGVILVFVFNVTNNSFLFNDIGIFPFFMIASTILFFGPTKTKKCIAKIFPGKKEKKLSKKQKKKIAKK
ncbi:MAG: HTTM domain-containing protein, partial [Marinirhabdus sp.]